MKNKMTSRVLILLLALTIPGARAADGGSPPELRGMLAAGGERRFALATVGSDQTGWVAVGETFAGWKVAEYHAADDSIVLSRDGKQVTVHLSSSVIGTTETAPATPATLADAEDVLNKMKFGQMMTQARMQSMFDMIKKMGGGKALTPDQQAAQSKVMEAMAAAMNSDEVRAGVAQAYSEVFTADELHGLADFYGTPTGQALINKQSELSQKMMAAMIPPLTKVLHAMKPQATAASQPVSTPPVPATP